LNEQAIPDVVTATAADRRRIAVRETAKAALALAGRLAISGTAAAAGAGPALASEYGIQLLCSASANGGTPVVTSQGSLCVLPFGQTTAPNTYSATIAHGGLLAVVAGGLPPGLTLSGDLITGNPTKTGTFNFTIKGTKDGETATLVYEITVTVQGPPDSELCSPSVNSGFPEGSTCVLPDALAGVPYQVHLPTSHQAGGTLSVVAGALPPGLTLPATFGTSGDVLSGTPAPQDAGNTYTFDLQGTGDQGQPLYQADQLTVDPNQPLAINASGGTALGPGIVGGAFGQNFFLSGGDAPYTWSVAAGQLPPSLHLQTFSDPRDVNDELAGTPTKAGTYTFTMKLTDYAGQQATQQFTLTIDPPLQITSTTLPAGTVGVAYRHDLTAQGGDPPYSFFIFQNDPLPPGLSFASAAPGSDNILTGTPTKAGTFSFTLQVQDSHDNTATATVTVTVDP
jgi:large repetitive protein